MSLHDTPNFLACRDCGELYPLLSPNAFLGDDPDAEDADAYRAFLITHHTHHLACLWRRDTEVRADRPLWDPMATVMFEVTDGDRSYVVRATRQSIEEERSYHFVPGELEVGNAEVHIDSRDVRRGLDLRFYPHALRPAKIDRFLSVVHELITKIDPDQLVIAFDSADDPDESIACMPERIYNELLRRCAEIFDPWELPRVLDFLHDNRDADGLLALHVTRHIAALSA